MANYVTIESQVFNLLTSIKNDTQLDPKHEDYLGFVNCFEDGFINLYDEEAFIDLVTRPKYYACLMNMFNLTTESGFDLDETIFKFKTIL